MLKVNNKDVNSNYRTWVTGRQRSTNLVQTSFKATNDTIIQRSRDFGKTSCH